MARRAAVADVGQGEEPTNGAMPSAPEGSAERVSGPSCVNCDWTEADCTCPGGFTLAFDLQPKRWMAECGKCGWSGEVESAVTPRDCDADGCDSKGSLSAWPLVDKRDSGLQTNQGLTAGEESDTERFVTVNDYDANGEPSAASVRLEPSQPDLFPELEKAPGLWPDYQGKRIAEVHVSFSGDHDLDRESAVQTGEMEGRVSGSFEGYVTGHSYKRRKKGGGLIGGATVVIEQVLFGESESDLEAVREAAFAQAQEMISDEAAELLAMIVNERDGSVGAAEVGERVRVFLRSLVMPSIDEDGAAEDLPDDLQPSALEESLGIALGDEPEADSE